MDALREYWKLLLPLLLIQLGLMVAALISLLRKETQTRGPKWLWAVIIVLGELVGPIVYFAFGRKD